MRVTVHLIQLFADEPNSCIVGHRLIYNLSESTQRWKGVLAFLVIRDGQIPLWETRSGIWRNVYPAWVETSVQRLTRAVERTLGDRMIACYATDTCKHVCVNEIKIEISPHLQPGKPKGNNRSFCSIDGGRNKLDRSSRSWYICTYIDLPR